MIKGLFKKLVSDKIKIQLVPLSTECGYWEYHDDGEVEYIPTRIDISDLDIVEKTRVELEIQDAEYKFSKWAKTDKITGIFVPGCPVLFYLLLDRLPKKDSTAQSFISEIFWCAIAGGRGSYIKGKPLNKLARWKVKND